MKTIKIAVLTPLILCCTIASTIIDAQSTFQKFYGGDKEEIGHSGIQTEDGGYLAVGSTNSFGAGGLDVYLIKTDEYGDTLWTKTYGGTGSDYGSCVQEIPDTGYIIAGYTESYGSGGADAYVIKTDLNGDTLWTENYGGGSDDRAYSVLIVDDGYILAGRTINSNSKVYLVKINKTSGAVLWEKEFGSTSSGHNTKQTSDGGLITCGSHQVWHPDWEMDVNAGYLIKTKADGSLIWI